MSRHIPRHERWSKHGPNEYRSCGVFVRYEKGAWWALVPYQLRASDDDATVWDAQQDRIGPFKRPRNAMIAAEERVLLLQRRQGERVRIGGT
jgi:hypothetical protein